MHGYVVLSVHHCLKITHPSIFRHRPPSLSAGLYNGHYYAIFCLTIHRPPSLPCCLYRSTVLFSAPWMTDYCATLCPMVHRPLSYFPPHGSQTFFAPLLSRMSWSMDWRMMPLSWAEPLLICFWMVSDTSRKQFHACMCVWVWVLNASYNCRMQEIMGGLQTSNAPTDGETRHGPYVDSKSGQYI